ncbi:MAG: mannonate dehydratase [Treponema sp.]|jgi:mannonate dehydratase|nr:mannonate dehydratase [Treponema sp.]
MNTDPNSCYGSIKLSAYVPPEAAEEDIAFLAWTGIPYAYTWMGNLAERQGELALLKKRLAERGVTLYNAGDLGVAKSANIHLATEDRDRDIARFNDMLRALAKTGIFTTTFTWEPDHVWSTAADAPGRGGAKVRMVDERQLETVPVKHGRIYEKDELWENFRYFMKKVIPVSEETGVRLALHPNDPPMPMIGGVATLINSAADYRQAFDIAGSPNLGMEFCCGCWLEGGGRFGDILEGVRTFVREGRVFITHLRNVSAPLPLFKETFLDDGYMDIYALIRAFFEAGYDGTMIFDHTPEVPGGNAVSAAYEIGYMKAVINAAGHQYKAG